MSDFGLLLAAGESVHGVMGKRLETAVDNCTGDAISVEIEQLQRLQIHQLRERYREVFAEETWTNHKQHLVRRIAWRLQMLAQGDLSERARQRALDIANDADLRIQIPTRWLSRTNPAESGRKSRHDGRVPAVGTVLTRLYQGRQIAVTVLPDGFEYEGRHYGSLSAIASEVTGTRWNGLLFFGLTKRKESRGRR
jgi:hypothetical protein